MRRLLNGKSVVLGAVLLASLSIGSLTSVAYATVKTPPPPIVFAEIGGLVTAVFADPSDFVVQLDNKIPGSCGSQFFHIRRANEKFKEMVAIALTAFSLGKRLTFFIDSCSSDRNIISHGYVSR